VNPGRIAATERPTAVEHRPAIASGGCAALRLFRAMVPHPAAVRREKAVQIRQKKTSAPRADVGKADAARLDGVAS